MPDHYLIYVDIHLNVKLSSLLSAHLQLERKQRTAFSCYKIFADLNKTCLSRAITLVAEAIAKVSGA